MGKSLLIGSCEPFSGKSAFVLGVSRQLMAAKQDIRFGKPLATSLELGLDLVASPSSSKGPLIDDDVRFIGDTLGLSENQLIPSLHLLGSSTADQRLSDSNLDAGEGFEVLKSKLKTPFDGLNILEAAGSLHEGLLYGLSLEQLARGLDARVILVHLWQNSCSVEALLAAKEQLGDHLVGIVLNAVTPDEVHALKRSVVPSLEKLGLSVL